MVNIEVGEIKSLESLDKLIDYINEEALKYYKLKEDVILRVVEKSRKIHRFKTIDENGKLLTWNGSIKGRIGLRAVGRKSINWI